MQTNQSERLKLAAKINELLLGCFFGRMILNNIFMSKPPMEQLNLESLNLSDPVIESFNRQTYLSESGRQTLTAEGWKNFLDFLWDIDRANFTKEAKKQYKDSIMLLRIALTGGTEGPDLFKAMEVLGIKEVVERVQHFQDVISKA